MVFPVYPFHPCPSSWEEYPFPAPPKGPLIRGCTMVGVEQSAETCGIRAACAHSLCSQYPTSHSVSRGEGREGWGREEVLESIQKGPSPLSRGPSQGACPSLGPGPAQAFG